MILRGICLALGVVALSACGGSRPTSPPENLACNLSKYQVRDDYIDVYGRIRTAEINKGGIAEINVLQLSAGGGFGAYGAGYLLGWNRVGPEARPVARKNIQVVTGVSTGALMATHAFLATYDTSADWDRQLQEFYLNVTDAQIYSKRSFSLIWANSLYDTAGKKKLLEKHVRSDMIERVKDAPPRQGLFIGFVNLDSSEFVRIDMVALAKGSFDNVAQRDSCYRAVIDASTAIEVAFPPVFIDDGMMADGGARQYTFLVSPNQPSNSDVMPAKFRSFSLVHGDLEVGPLPGDKVKNGVVPIAERTAAIFADQSMKSSVRLSNALAYDPAVVVGKENAKKLPRFEMFYSAAAKAACDCSSKTETECGPDTPHAADLFCPAFMSCLAQAGEVDGAAAASSGKWLNIEDLHLGSKPSCRMPGLNFR